MVKSPINPTQLTKWLGMGLKLIACVRLLGWI